MDIGNWIAIGSVLAALLTIIVRQWQLVREERKKDNRTANKLKLLYLCQTEGLSEGHIIDRYKKQHPLDSVDEVEIRKTIYEMLADQTLVFIADTETYEVRSHLPRKAGRSSLDASDARKHMQQQMIQQQQ